MAEVSQVWLDRVKRAQQMAAERRGVDVSVMLPPRNGGPAEEAAAEVAIEPVPAPSTAAAEIHAEVVSSNRSATAVVTEDTTSSAEEEAAAARVAEAKDRAAARTVQTNGSQAGAASVVAVPDRVAPVTRATLLESVEAGHEGINRREFLTYAWAGALGLLTLESGLATYQFMYPRFRAGEFGGKFILGPATELPPTNLAPQGNTTGKFWLVNTDEGPHALYMVCTHLGCLYKWESSNNRFECPCHGSKFSREGHYIEGPAPRSLDQFLIEVVEGTSVVATTEDAGDKITAPPAPGAEAEIVVDTGKRIQGKPAATSPTKAV